MQTITRHGGGSHYVRPDRVYRTGVLTSVMGYQPGPDAQAVAASFTQYPMDLRTPSADGLSGPRFSSFMASMKSRWQIFKAKTKAKMGMNGLGQLRDFTPDAQLPGMTYMQVGRQISPQAFGPSEMTSFLQQNGMTPSVADSMNNIVQNRINANWWG